VALAAQPAITVPTITLDGTRMVSCRQRMGNRRKRDFSLLPNGIYTIPEVSAWKHP
jgi:hypothetical protein